jgi:hypothetical protein
MTLPSTHELTQLLKAWTAGDQALEKLILLLYRQLHQLAQCCMVGERSNHTFQSTALVNEVYLVWGTFFGRIGVTDATDSHRASRSRARGDSRPFAIVTRLRRSPG